MDWTNHISLMYKSGKHPRWKGTMTEQNTAEQVRADLLDIIQSIVAGASLDKVMRQVIQKAGLTAEPAPVPPFPILPAGLDTDTDLMFHNQWKSVRQTFKNLLEVRDEIVSVLMAWNAAVAMVKSDPVWMEPD